MPGNFLFCKHLLVWFLLTNLPFASRQLDYFRNADYIEGGSWVLPTQTTTANNKTADKLPAVSCFIMRRKLMHDRTTHTIRRYARI
jgi:hypothetical protein